MDAPLRRWLLSPGGSGAVEPRRRGCRSRRRSDELEAANPSIEATLATRGTRAAVRGPASPGRGCHCGAGPRAVAARTRTWTHGDLQSSRPSDGVPTRVVSLSERRHQFEEREPERRAWRHLVGDVTAAPGPVLRPDGVGLRSVEWRDALGSKQSVRPGAGASVTWEGMSLRRWLPCRGYKTTGSVARVEAAPGSCLPPE